MSRRPLVIGGCLLAALVLFTLRSGSVAQERKDAGNIEGPFVSIVKKSNPNSSTDLENAQVRELKGGRLFIVGVGADVPDNWQKGRTVAIALDDVSEVTTFATLEELRKAGIPPDGARKDGE